MSPAISVLMSPGIIAQLHRIAHLHSLMQMLRTVRIIIGLSKSSRRGRRH